MKKEKARIELLHRICACATVCAILVLVPVFSSAAEDPVKFPSKPISMIVTFNPGSSTDLTARKLAETAGRILGKPIVIEDRPGGAGVIGTNDVVKADPDGYTIGAVTYSAPVVTPHLTKVPYNTKEDFSWILIYAELSVPFVVLPNAPWKTFKEYIEDARRTPGKLTYATPGAKGGPNIIVEQVAALENVKLSHIPTSGGSEVVSFVLGGHVDAAMAIALSPHLRTKKVRALFIGSENRIDAAPDVPTLHEMGYKVEFPVQWTGLCAPKGISPLIFKKLTEAFKKAYADPSFQQLVKKFELTPMYKDPESARQMINRDFDIMGKIAKKFDLKM